MRPLVIRFGRLGDMILLAPLLEHLHRRFGERCVVFGPGPWSRELYAGHPDVGEVLQVNVRHRPLPISPQRWRMVRALWRERGSPVFVCETEPRALDKIRRMLALARVDPGRCLFITDFPTSAAEHWVDRLLRFAAQTPAALMDARPAGDPVMQDRRQA
jgi:heptosyltransferase-2/heptosyltransferase-3